MIKILPFVKTNDLKNLFNYLTNKEATAKETYICLHKKNSQAE